MLLLRRAALALAVVLSAHAARAGEVEVVPVLISLSRAEKSAVIRVRNRSPEPARYQIGVFSWDQTLEGEMKLAPTEEILAFPRVLSLQPNEEKIIRVGAKTAFGPVEKPYRMFIEEMPPPAKPDQPSRVQVLSRIGLPVFLAPDRAVEKTAIGGVRVEGGKAAFLLQNLGNVHVRPTSVRAVLEDGAGKAVDERTLSAWYVLANAQRAYGFEIPREKCVAVKAFAVEVVLPKETLRARVDVPQGACGS
jgi:fimbrial chaperone protein